MPKIEENKCSNLDPSDPKVLRIFFIAYSIFYGAELQSAGMG